MTSLPSSSQLAA